MANGCTGSLRTYQISLFPESVGGQVTPHSTVCAGINSGTLQLEDHTGSIVRWEYSVNEGSTWQGIANTTTSHTFNNLPETTWYRAIIQNGVCDETPSAHAIITVDPASVGGTISGGTTVCEGTNATLLSLSGHTGNVVRWDYSVNGGMSWDAIAHTGDSYTAENLTQTTQFRAVIQSGVCDEAYSSVGEIVVSTGSEGGTVSGGTTVCESSNNTQLTLSGHLGNVIRWESSTDGGIIWTAIANTTTTHTAINLSQTTLFRAVVQSTPCDEAFSTGEEIAVSPLSLGGSVSGGTTVCEGINSTQLSLTGQIGEVIRWESSTNGGATWTSIAHTESTYTAENLSQTTHYRAIVQSGTCPEAASLVAIIETDPVSVGGSAGPDQLICGNTIPDDLSLSGHTGQVVRWQRADNAGFVSATDIPETGVTLTGATIGPLTQTTYFRAVVQSGACAEAFSSHTVITVEDESVGGTAGPDQEICAGETPADISLSGHTGDIVMWQQSADISFTTPLDIPETSATLAGLVIGTLDQTTYFRAVVQSGICEQTYSTIVTVNVKPIPHLTTSLNPPGICSNTGFVYEHAFSVPGTTFFWERPVISGIDNPPASSDLDYPDEILLNTTNIPIEVVYYYTLSANGCTTQEEVRVNVTQSPILINEGFVGSICGGTVFSFIPESNIASGVNYNWTRAADAYGNSANSGTGNPNEVLVNNSDDNITVTYYYLLDAGGCSNPQTYHVNVTVVPSPIVTVSASDENICEGESIDLFSSSNIQSSLPPVILEENFNDTDTEWTINPTSGDGIWTLRENNYTYNYFVWIWSFSETFRSNDNSQFFLSNGRAQAGTYHLTSPVFTTQGYSSATLTFWHHYNDRSTSGSNNDRAIVEWSPNGSTGWNDLATFTSNQGTSTGFVQVTLNIPVGIPTIYLRFRYVGTPSANWWAIDNVTITGEPAAEPVISWTSVPPGFTSSVANPTNVTPSETTTYYVTYTDPDTGCNGTNSVTVNVYDAPVPEIVADYCVIRPKVLLTAEAGFASYQWNTGETTQSIEVDIAGTYTVAVTDVNGCIGNNSIQVAEELVVNGDFSLGNFGFTSEYLFSDQLHSGGQFGATGGEALFTIGPNARLYHSNFWGYDHTVGDGVAPNNFMIVNGYGDLVVWEQTVSVTPNTDYYFAAWAISLNTHGPFARLRFEVNGGQVGTIAEMVSGVNSNANPWRPEDRFYGMWNSGSATTAVIRIINLEPALGGNDFGLDDISFGTLANVEFTVNANNNGPLCAGGDLELTSTVTGGKHPITYSWTGPNGFTSTEANPVISAVTAAHSGTYTVAVVDGYGCPAIIAETIVTIDPTPSIPHQMVTICSGEAFMISPVDGDPDANTIVPAGTTYTWTSPAGSGFTGGSAQAVPQTSISQTLVNTTNNPVVAVYTVTPSTPTCSGESFEIEVTINPAATVDAGAPQSVCADSPQVQLEGSFGGAATSAIWSGGMGTFDPDENTPGALYTPHPDEITAGSVMLTLTTNDPDGDGPCPAVSDNVLITIFESPVITLDATNVACFEGNNGSINLSVSGGTAPFGYTWTASDGGAIPPGQENSQNLSNLVAGTYHVTATDNNSCPAIAEVTITQPELLEVFADYTDILCVGETTMVTITATGGTGPYTGIGTFEQAEGGHTYIVTDDNGCTADITVNLVVAESNPPQITVCPPDMPDIEACDVSVILALTGLAFSESAVSITAEQFLDAGGEATDDCGITSLSYIDNLSGSCPITVVRTFTVSNAAGLEDSCSQTFTISDNEAPSFTVPADMTVFTDADCLYDIDPDVTGWPDDVADNCDADPVISYTDSDPVEGTCANELVIIRTWTVRDACGNEHSEDQTITISDNIIPSFDAPDDITLFAGADCFADIDPTVTGNATNITDNCADDLVATYADVIDNTDPCEIIITRTWSLVDHCGNAAPDQVQIITIIDNTPPVFTRPPDTEIYTDALCNYDASVINTGDVFDEFDNCSSGLVATFTDVVDDTDPCNTVILRTWRLVDDCGNEAAEQVQTIHVINNQSPLIYCPSNTAVLYGSSIHPDDTGWATASDPCGTDPVITWSDAIVEGSCIGNYQVERTWRATNVCGNFSECIQIISVQDIEAPLIICSVIEDQIVEPNNDTQYIHPDTSWDATATDNTGVVYLEVSLSGATVSGPHPSLQGVTFELGITTVFWFATDDCGNTSMCMFEVELLPNDPPEIACPPDQTVPTAPGICTADVDPGEPTLLSGYEPVTWSWEMSGATTGSGDGYPVTPLPYTFNLGVTTITWTATNISGSDQCAHIVEVVDMEAPVVDTPEPIEFCVNNLILARYNGTDELDYNPEYPYPYPLGDYFLFVSGNTTLDLDLGTYQDNCCDLSDGYLIEWLIEFDGVEPDVSGAGQPSGYGTDFKLWGDGINHQNRTHTITYWVTDCNGNRTDGISALITVTPRPQIIKLNE